MTSLTNNSLLITHWIYLSPHADLRVQLGGDGNAIANSPTMLTPNIDKLIGKGLFLRKAQVQQAVCSPTRTSILTSQ